MFSSYFFSPLFASRFFNGTQALGDRPQYHIYLEEVDTTPDVWSRRRATPGELPAKEAGQLLLAGRAYAQLPNEVFLVFLKIDRRVSTRRANRLAVRPQADRVCFTGLSDVCEGDREREREKSHVGCMLTQKADVVRLVSLGSLRFTVSLCFGRLLFSKKILPSIDDTTTNQPPLYSSPPPRTLRPFPPPSARDETGTIPRHAHPHPHQPVPSRFNPFFFLRNKRSSRPTPAGNNS